MNARERELFADALWRSKHDPFLRSQFAEIPEGNGYFCESGMHEEREARYRRPPMPEKRARFAVLFCADCWRRLPE